MRPEEMKLTEPEKFGLASKIAFNPDWVIDPPPWIIARLPDDILVDVYKTKLEHLAEIAKIESRMFSKVAEVMAKQR